MGSPFGAPKTFHSQGRKRTITIRLPSVVTMAKRAPIIIMAVALIGRELMSAASVGSASQTVGSASDSVGIGDKTAVALNMGHPRIALAHVQDNAKTNPSEALPLSRAPRVCDRNLLRNSRRQCR